MARAEGIEVRHRNGCSAPSGGRCNCTPSYRASAWSRAEGKLVRKTFTTKAAARSWRHDAMSARKRGELKAPSKRSVREAADAWIENARAGRIRNRSGDEYKPSAIRGYEKALRLRVLPTFGDARLSDVRRVDLQEWIDGMLAEGLAASTIDASLNPLRAIFRHAVARNEVGVNPTRGLELPAIRSKPKRIVPPEEAAKLLAAVLEGDRATWATAMYAGLRRGELQALTWERIDLGAGLIHVEQGWDQREGAIDLKSHAGRRRVPLAGVLRDLLLEHKIRTGRDSGFAFGSESEPFSPRGLAKRADEAWGAAKLDRVTLHACRHTFASYMIAAGVNAKALSTYMGHANIAITLDLYGHLMPGNEDEAAGLLDAYLTAARNREDDQARRVLATNESLTHAVNPT